MTRNLRRWSEVVAVMVLLSAAARPAFATATVFGNAMAQLCADAAHVAAQVQKLDAKAGVACDLALSAENLSLRDRAGTFVNRGVLRLARGRFAAAQEDFDAAASLKPDLGAAYTNKGAALIALERYADAVAYIDKGLELNAEEPEKAYFNRALADEALDDLKRAYLDYLQASRLKPDWDQPRIELTRFTVAKP